MEPRSGCPVEKVIVIKSVGQEMLVKVNVNIFQRVPIRSCSCPSQSWEDGHYRWMEALRIQPRIEAIRDCSREPLNSVGQGNV